MQSEAGYQNWVSHNSDRKILSDSRTRASFFQPIQYIFHQMKIDSVSNMEMGLIWISILVQYNADPPVGHHPSNRKPILIPCAGGGKFHIILFTASTSVPYWAVWIWFRNFSFAARDWIEHSGRPWGCSGWLLNSIKCFDGSKKVPEYYLKMLNFFQRAWKLISTWHKLVELFSQIERIFPSSIL